MKDSEEFSNGDSKKTKLTDWKKEPTCAELKADYQLAGDYHSNHMAKVKDWTDCYNAEGAYAAPDIKGRSKIAPKLVRKLIEWRVPALTEPFLSRNDLFQVEPVTFEDVKAAKQNGLLINYQFRNKLNITKFIDAYVRAGTKEGTSIVRTGWNLEEKEVDVEKPVYTQEYAPEMEQTYMQLIQQAQQQPEIMEQVDPLLIQGAAIYEQTGESVRIVQTGFETVKEVKVIQNHPTVEVCEIGSVYVDPSCYGDLNKANFLIYAFETSKADLIKDGNYPNVENFDVKSAAEPAGDKISDNREVQALVFDDEERKKFIAYEYWGYYDIHDTGDLRPIVATWAGDTIIRLEENPFPDGQFPFVFVQLLPMKDSLYGEPDAELLKDNQKVIGATTRGMIDLLARSANGQTGFSKGFLDTTNFNRYNNGENYMFNNIGRVDSSIVMHKFPEIPQSAFAMQQFWNTEAESMTGMRPFSTSTAQQGVADGGQTSRNAMDAASKRELSIIRRFSDGLIEIAKKFIAMNSMFLTEEDYIRVTNNEFVPIDPEDLAGEFDLKINISTAEEDAAKTEQLAFLLQTGQSTLPFDFTKMILSKIATLRKMPELATFIDEYQPEPDPMEGITQELAVAKAKAEIAKLNMEAAESDAKRKVYEAEVGVREARRDNLQGKTDKDNLSFYKDANGLKQQEDIEKMDLQESANIARERDKHAMDMEKTRLGHNSSIMQKFVDNDMNPKQRNGL